MICAVLIGPDLFNIIIRRSRLSRSWILNPPVFWTDFPGCMSGSDEAVTTHSETRYIHKERLTLL
jgi:hypothetical protein